MWKWKKRKKVVVMISMKSKFKVLYPAILIEWVLATGLGYLSTLVQMTIFKLVCEDVSLILFIVCLLYTSDAADDLLTV